MRTSLLETQEIESHLMRSAEPGDSLVFEAKLLLEPGLQDKILWQQKTYEIVRQYGRAGLRQEIENVHQKLFNEARHQSFKQKIMRLFSKK
jgi:hypothetical protein